MIFCFFLFAYFANANEKFLCEFRTQTWFRRFPLKTCNIGNVVIDSPQTEIGTALDEEVEAFNMRRNKNIQFFPASMSEKFPNLRAFEASHCSVKIILNSNFKGLSKLTHLFLGSNQIERIEVGMFDGLTSLKQLNLGKKCESSRTSLIFLNFR